VSDLVCCVAFCNRKVLAKEYCQRHYYQIRNIGYLIGEEKERNTEHNGICKISGCNRKYYANGLCKIHYKRELRKVTKGLSKKICVIDGCTNRVNAKQMCSKHYCYAKRYRNKIKAIRQRGSICERCGYNDTSCLNVFEFHHANDEEKDKQLSVLFCLLDWNKIQTELDKCVMLCANCHRKVHANNFSSELLDRMMGLLL
jgi:hypothetical protein